MRASGFTLRNPESLQFDHCALLTRIIPVLLDSWGFFLFQESFTIFLEVTCIAHRPKARNIYVCTSKSARPRGGGCFWVALIVPSTVYLFTQRPSFVLCGNGALGTCFPASVICGSLSCACVCLHGGKSWRPLTPTASQGSARSVDPG